MLVKMGTFPNFRGEHKKYLSCHHPENDGLNKNDGLFPLKNTTPPPTFSEASSGGNFEEIPLLNTSHPAISHLHQQGTKHNRIATTVRPRDSILL